MELPNVQVAFDCHSHLINFKAAVLITKLCIRLSSQLYGSHCLVLAIWVNVRQIRCLHIMESVDSINKDGLDTPIIAIQHKNLITLPVLLFKPSRHQIYDPQPIYLTSPTVS